VTYGYTRKARGWPWICQLQRTFCHILKDSRMPRITFPQQPLLLSSFIFAAIFAAEFFCAKQHADAAESTRPNIVLMMADDMGFSDIGCYGSEIQTPHLDELARGGIRFTQFYNTSRCCPTRAALMTGLYPHQAGIGHMMNDRGYDGYRGNLNQQCRTIAEVLSDAGYRTYMSGKWHVTRHVSADGPKFNWPRQRGFDRFFGTIHGAGSFYDPNSLTRGNQHIAPGKDFFYTDAIVDNAIKFASDHKQQNASDPFFMYVAFTCPHWPMHAREHNIAKYKGKYAGGWDALRKTRHQRMIKMGIVNKDWEATARDSSAPAWQDAERKDWHQRRMEVYAAMIDCMDQNIGRLIAALKKNGQFDNTLMLFLADNGGCAEEYGSRGAVHHGGKRAVQTPKDGAPALTPMKPGELQTAMQPRVTRDGKPVRTGRGVMPGPADTYIAYGLPWANASNTPFRRYKHWVHEGGISSPLICHWPKGIAVSQHNKLFHSPAHLIDIMATCVDLAGASYPGKSAAEKNITPMQGISLRPSFSGQALQREQPIFWEHEGNRAIRIGEWKLVAKGAAGPWELYNMVSDRTELHDLSSKMPERTSAMAKAWEAWAVKAMVKPWPYGKQPKKKPAQRKKPARQKN